MGTGQQALFMWFNEVILIKLKRDKGALKARLLLILK
jgi:hypothetical protein